MKHSQYLGNRWVSAIFAGLLLLLAFGLFRTVRSAWSLKAYLRNKSEVYARVRTMGYPTNVAQWVEGFPPIPDEQNAFVAMQGAIKIIEGIPEGIPPGMWPTSMIPTNSVNFNPSLIPEATARDWIDYLVPLEKPMNEIRAACQLPGAWLPNWTNPVTIIYPWFRPVQTRMIHLFCNRSILRARSDDLSNGFDDIITAWRITQVWDHSPSIIDVLDTFRVQRQLFLTMEGWLNADLLSASQMEQLDGLLAELGDQSELARSILLENLMFSNFTENLNARTLVQSYGAPDTMINRIKADLFVQGGQRDLERTALLRFTESNLIAHRAPTQKRAEELRRAIRERVDAVQLSPLKKWFGAYSLVPGMLNGADGFVDMELATLAHGRCLRTILAVERFRRANKEEIPNQLKDLIPDFLPALLPDPFSGQNLRYAKDSTGCMVYSVGSDGKDHGGFHQSQASGINYDIVVELARRRPPKGREGPMAQ